MERKELVNYFAAGFAVAVFEATLALSSNGSPITPSPMPEHPFMVSTLCEGGKPEVGVWYRTPKGIHLVPEEVDVLVVISGPTNSRVLSILTGDYYTRRDRDFFKPDAPYNGNYKNIPIKGKQAVEIGVYNSRLHRDEKKITFAFTGIRYQEKIKIPDCQSYNPRWSQR